MSQEKKVLSVGIKVDTSLGLHKLNLNDPLKKIIEDLCQQYNKDNPLSWDLQLVETKTKGVKFITEETLHEIHDGAVLRLVPSAKSMASWISTVTKDSNPNKQEDKLTSLLQLSVDPVFIREIIENNFIQELPQIATNFIEEKRYNCLVCICNVFENTNSNDNIFKIQRGFVEFLILRLKDTDNGTHYKNTLLVCLKLIGHILTLEGGIYFQFIYDRLPIKDLIPNLWNKDIIEIQIETLHVINTYFEYSILHKELIVEELNSEMNKSIIYNNVLSNGAKCSDLAHQLYVLQTNILSVYKKYLRPVRISGYEEIAKRNTMIDFHENDTENKRNTIVSTSSTEMPDIIPSVMEDESDNAPYNRTSSDSMLSIDTVTLDEPVVFRRTLNKVQSVKLKAATTTELTKKCLEYFKSHYEKNYRMAVLETNYEPGFYKISDQIVAILCDVFQIGKEPLPNCVNYHPLAFRGQSNKSFIEEIFCRALWMMSQIRREMKARDPDDHDTVLKVLKEELMMALAKRSMKFSEFTQVIKGITYKHVADIWNKRMDDEWNNQIRYNPSIQEIKPDFIASNENLIREQRMRILLEGEEFMRVPFKKGKHQLWSVSLSKNKRSIQWTRMREEVKVREEVLIQDIQYVVSGKACPHIKDSRIKKEELFPRCFSILLEAERTLDFIADNEETAQLWVEGLNLLLNPDHFSRKGLKEQKSKRYEQDLQMLLEMDLNLYLLDLQNVPLPKKPPPIPALPKEFRVKPTVPPKSPLLKKQENVKSFELPT